MRDFDSWAIHQGHDTMLDAFIPPNADEINADNRVTRVINAMRSGNALVLTEKFIEHVYTSTGQEGIDEWISAHVGFFLSVPKPNISSSAESVKHMGTRVSSVDDRFYSAIERENERWTR